MSVMLRNANFLYAACAESTACALATLAGHIVSFPDPTKHVGDIGAESQAQ